MREFKNLVRETNENKRNRRENIFRRRRTLSEGSEDPRSIRFSKPDVSACNKENEKPRTSDPFQGILQKPRKRRPFDQSNGKSDDPVREVS